MTMPDCKIDCMRREKIGKIHPLEVLIWFDLTTKHFILVCFLHVYAKAKISDIENLFKGKILHQIFKASYDN